LNIVGKNLNPDEITKMLGIQPDDSFQQGESFGKNKRTKQGCWTLEGCPEGAPFGVQLENLITRIEPVRDKLKKIIESKDVEQAYLTIGVQPPDEVWIAGYCFDAELINKFTSLGIDIALSLHMPID
jgi:hypothetical protein